MVNPPTGLTAGEIASSFLEEFPSFEGRELCTRFLEFFHERDVDRCSKIEKELNGSEFRTVKGFLLTRQFFAFLKKVPFGPDETRKAAAIKTFLACEQSCKRVNRKLDYYWARPDRMPDNIRVVLSRARGFISKLLGEVSEETLGWLLSASRPGKGLCIGTRNKVRTSLPYKLGDTDLTVTASALPYARLLVEGDPHWAALHSRDGEILYDIREASDVRFVPKSYKTHRSIAIEPALNVQLQLGVHEFFRMRLRRVGVDIGDQSRNQDLARRGSVNPSFCSTLDLSSASDTVSRSLVQILLPPSWVGLLDDLRCKTVNLEGSTLELHKWSSMGNGYTFALETLIFWALGKAVNSITSDELLGVYGDDIIVAPSSALLLIEVLRFCGFKTNIDKSFVISSFKESCGCDVYYGADVTPLYLKGEKIFHTDAYRLLNHRRTGHWFRRSLIAAIKSTGTLLLGNSRYGDTSCLHVHLLPKRGTRWNSHLQRTEFKYITWRQLEEEIPEETRLAAGIRRVSAEQCRYIQDLRFERLRSHDRSDVNLKSCFTTSASSPKAPVRGLGKYVHRWGA